MHNVEQSFHLQDIIETPIATDRKEAQCLLETVTYEEQPVVPLIVKTADAAGNSSQTIERWGAAFPLVARFLSRKDFAEATWKTLDQVLRIFHETNFILLDRVSTNTLVLKKAKEPVQVRQCDLGALYNPVTGVALADSDQKHQELVVTAREKLATTKPEDFIATLVWEGFIDLVRGLTQPVSLAQFQPGNKVQLRLREQLLACKEMYDKPEISAEMTTEKLRHILDEFQK